MNFEERSGIIRSLGCHEDYCRESEEWELDGDCEQSISEARLLLFPPNDVSLILKEDIYPGDLSAS